VLTLILSGCGTTFTDSKCPPAEVNRYLTEHDTLLDKFLNAEDAMRNSKDRNDWTAAITDMRNIKNQAENLNSPTCAKDVQDAFIAIMDAGIRSYQTAFDGDLDKAMTLLELQNQAIKTHDQAIDALGAELGR
jgi:hypothetical protein